MSGIALNGQRKVFKRELLLRGVGRPRRQWIGHDDEADGWGSIFTLRLPLIGRGSQTLASTAAL